MEQEKIKVTVGAVIFKGNKILFGKSINPKGETKYILPVGHLEYMESFKECAKREIKEECGIEIKNIKFQFVSNTDDYKPTHYIHIGLTAEWKSGTPEVLEEGWIKEWIWIEKDNIPTNLSKGTDLTIKALEERKYFYDLNSF